MQHLSLLLALAFPFFLNAQSAADVQAIKAMCGCYEVRFNFAETFSYPQDSSYVPSKVKHDGGLEWVELIEDAPGRLVLQHLLIVSDTMIVKHWRQDWLYENTEVLSYKGFNDWERLSLPSSEIKGQWTQKVFQVDDSPRYEGSGSWVHSDGRHYWESMADAPLPRREFTVRSDYNLLRRRNRHEITAEGWLHEQDNDKIICDTEGGRYLLAQEKGMNPYTKVDEARCLAAQVWWAENSTFWAKARQKWNHELAQRTYVKLKKSLDGKPLFMHLFNMPPDASQAEIDTVIDSFFEATP